MNKEKMIQVRVNASVSELRLRGIPQDEAERLSGTIQVATLDKFGSYLFPAAIGCSRQPECPGGWSFTDKSNQYITELPEVVSTLDLTKPVQMRNGCPVEIKYIDKSLEYPINGIMTCKNGKRFAASWRIDGTIYSDGSPCENDLVQSPEPLIEGWLNLYDSTTHPTKEEADEYADADRTACIKVSYRKGEGL